MKFNQLEGYHRAPASMFKALSSKLVPQNMRRGERERGKGKEREEERERKKERRQTLRRMTDFVASRTPLFLPTTWNRQKSKTQEYGQVERAKVYAFNLWELCEQLVGSLWEFGQTSLLRPPDFCLLLGQNEQTCTATAKSYKLKKQKILHKRQSTYIHLGFTSIFLSTEICI